MSYRAESTISLECELWMCKSLWKGLCVILGILLFHIFDALTEDYFIAVVHGSK